MASIEMGAMRGSANAAIVTTALLATLLSVLFYVIAMQGQAARWKRIGLAVPFGVAIGVLPVLLRQLGARLPGFLADGAVMLTSAFAGAFLFGVYLTALALLGIEHQQAFTVLGHPGYKHFVRLCVHPDGRVEGWAIGKDDMLDESAPLLVDRWVWKEGAEGPIP